jgi:hypothetical protein
MVIQIERLFGFVFPRNATTNDLLAIAYISVFPNALLYFVSKNIKRATISLLFNFASGKLDHLWSNCIMNGAGSFLCMGVLITNMKYIT